MRTPGAAPCSAATVKGDRTGLPPRLGRQIKTEARARPALVRWWSKHSRRLISAVHRFLPDWTVPGHRSASLIAGRIPAITISRCNQIQTWIWRIERALARAWGPATEVVRGRFPLFAQAPVLFTRASVLPALATAGNSCCGARCHRWGPASGVAPVQGC